MKVLPLLLIAVTGWSNCAISGETRPPETTPEVDCSNAVSRPEITFCADKRLAVADKEMNDLYKQQMKSLITAVSKAALCDSQRAWLAFMNKTCFYEVGETQPDWSLCLETRTKARIVELKAYIACTGGGCPV